jgi:rod shape-determining protein MreD
MHIIRYALLLILAFVLQTTWVEFLVLSSLKPDLVLLVLIFLALREGPMAAMALGFFIGLLQDVYAPTDLGLNALLKCTVGFAVGYGRTRVVGDNIQVQVAFICIAVLVHDLFYYAFTSAISLGNAPFFWMRYGIGRAIYTGLIGALASALQLLRRRFLPI